jgi:hypothetical protein
MLMNLFAGLFTSIARSKAGGMSRATGVQRFGKWYCSEMHADLYELELYEVYEPCTVATLDVTVSMSHCRKPWT